VVVPVAVSAVNVPAAAAVPPIAGGDARYALNPAPDTVLDAENVVVVIPPLSVIPTVVSGPVYVQPVSGQPVPAVASAASRVVITPL
jgi:hypothetical protein